MRIPKTLAISGTVVAAGLAGLVGVNVVHAASNPQDGQQSLVDTIASTFNLNKTDVQKVFDDQRQARQAAHQQKYEARVRQAVKDGTLTQDLADQLVAKQKELASYRDSLKGKTPAERRSAMKTEWDNFAQWARSNKIAQNLWPFGPRLEAQAPAGS